MTQTLYAHIKKKKSGHGVTCKRKIKQESGNKDLAIRRSLMTFLAKVR
jgi:hypothetical protein